MELVRIQVDQVLDEAGEPVEFTWDLEPLVESTQTSHLTDQGLPKTGTLIAPGMILVGRIGKTLSHTKSSEPTCFDYLTHSIPDLRAKFGHLWKDYSVYADAQTAGKVISACLARTSGQLVAIVELDRSLLDQP